MGHHHHYLSVKRGAFLANPSYFLWLSIACSNESHLKGSLILRLCVVVLSLMRRICFYVHSEQIHDLATVTWTLKHVEITVAPSAAMRSEWVFPRPPAAAPWAKLGAFPASIARLWTQVSQLSWVKRSDPMCLLDVFLILPGNSDTSVVFCCVHAGDSFPLVLTKNFTVFPKYYLVRILVSLLSKFALTQKTTLWSEIAVDVTE